MLCDDCRKNPATVRLIAIVDGNKTERNLCAACVARQKLQLRTDSSQSMLSAIISGANRMTMKYPGLRCSACGMEYDDFLKTSRLGCAQCYQDFKAQLRPLLIRLHGRAQHAGRVPEHVNDSLKVLSRMEHLRREMDLAVACEDFEHAAVLRDEMRELASACNGGIENA